MREFIIENLTNTESLQITVILMNNVVTLATAFFIMFTYKISYAGPAYSRKFNISIGSITIITAMIMSIISNNIALSLGMVGALSIVRFRTAIKEPLDIAFLFWSIAVGIVLAAGLIPLAVFGSAVIGIVLLVFVNKKSYSNPYIVVIQCEDHDSEVRAKEYLEQHTKRCVVKSKSAQKGMIELNLEIRLKEDNTDFINELADMPRVNSAVLVSYNGDYMG